MIGSSYGQWMPTKNTPRFMMINPDGRHNKGWEKEPGRLFRAFNELIFKHWEDLTDDQRRGIYNHEIKYTLSTAGRSAVKDSYYIFFEQRGTFEIKKSEATGKTSLSIVLAANGARYNLAEYPGQLGDATAVRWLKHFAQYLIDEPGELNVMICKQIPIAPYVNISAGLMGVPA